MLVSHSHRQSVKCSMRSNHDCWTALFWSCCTMSLYMNIQNSFYYCYNYREVSLSNHVSHIQCNLFCNELLLYVSLRLWHPVIWIYLIFKKKWNRIFLMQYNVCILGKHLLGPYIVYVCVFLFPGTSEFSLLGHMA